MTGTTTPRSLSLATDIDVLPPDRVVERRSRYLVVRSPSNPDHYWGNMLLFDDAPAAGDAAHWEALFAEEFAVEPRVRHHTFAWDRTDGELGAARTEFADRGYHVEQTIGLVAPPEAIRPHPRENRDVTVRVLDPVPGADDALWDAVVELQVSTREPEWEEQTYRDFRRRHTNAFRARFETGGGAWFAALDPASGEVVASCGIVVTGGRGRFQAVDTAEQYRRRGICSRLVVEAAGIATARFGAERFVIVADVDYHALGLYESLGFERAERVAGCYRRPLDA
jgi:ribosomal protein S18 acetylase RimI-like enzyme